MRSFKHNLLNLLLIACSLNMAFLPNSVASDQVNNRNDTPYGIKRPRSSNGIEPRCQRARLDTTPVTLCDMPPEIIYRVCSWLSLKDLFLVELYNKNFSNVLSDSYQYKALIDGWKLPDSNMPEKKKFIELLWRNPDYQVHFIDLWRNHFPLTYSNHLPLSYYWEIALTKSMAYRFISTYQYYKHSTLPGIGTSGENYQKALLGIAAIGIELGVNNDDYSLRDYRTQLGTLLQSESFPRLKMEATLLLSIMDVKPLGILLPNYAAARAGFQSVIDSPQALTQNKATAQLYLAQVNLFEQAGPINYAVARDGFQSVIDNPQALAHNRATARLNLASMKLFGQGGPINYAAARAGFQSVIDNPQAFAKNQAIAQLHLAKMNLLGQGGPINYAAAYAGFQGVISDFHGFAEDQASTQMRIKGRNYVNFEDHQSDVELFCNKKQESYAWIGKMN